MSRVLSTLSASNTFTSTFSASPAYTSTSTSSSAATSSPMFASATAGSPMPNSTITYLSDIVSQIHENKPNPQNSTLTFFSSSALASTSISAPATANSSISTSATTCSPMPNSPNIDPSNLVSQIPENKPTPQNFSNNLPTADNKLNE
ncbi:hypothetical protein F8M41_015365 [Gigaspora margarita]|uniref:Uncharacterized protein n=1 Tax=Gigaspora margarita TaxID=4874 RepID=A0A8H4B3H4_GIGMA|nr:hypothetical protein F8M41_015365 [Gigaspora margarita]